MNTSYLEGVVCIKKLMSVLLVLSLLSALVAVPALASTREIRVRVNDDYVVFDVKPVIESGRTLVPFRAIFEKLGAAVEWDAATNGVTAIKDDVTIKLTLNNRTAFVNGAPFTLDVAPKVIGGRTMVPLRFIVQSMGYPIEWVEETYEVIITVPPKQVPITAVNRITAPTQNSDRTGGTDVSVTYANNRLEILGEFAAIPAVATPGTVNTGIYYGFTDTNARWLGLTIPVPDSKVPASGNATIVIKEQYRAEVKIEDVKYSPDEPLNYYLAATAPGRTVTLDILWNNAYAESLTVEYKDTTYRKSDNLFVHTKAADFKGTHDKTSMVNVGDGAFALTLADGKYPPQGIYTSEIIYTPAFEYLVMSWNADTPPSTYVEVEARAMRADGVWTGWMSWGKWGRYIESSRANTSDNYARMDTDVFAIRGSQREEGIAIQYRVKLHSEDPAATPTVRLVAGTIRTTLAGRSIPKDYDKATVNPKLAIDLPVPQYSQYIRDPQFASVICSPTSLAMVMEYHGVKYLVEEVARATFDKGFSGYGNWSFNAAVAGSEGFMSYVDYFGTSDEDTIDLVRLELARGNPIITSVRYVNNLSVAASWPLLEGAPIASTSGHIVVIRGIKEKDGVLYFICNDPAAKDDEGVYREYRADQYLRAWHQRVAYIVRPTPGDGGTAAPQVKGATLEATGQTREHAGIQQAEFMLKDANGNKVSVSNRNGSRIISIVYRKDGEPTRYVYATNDEHIWINQSMVDKGYEWTIVLPAGEVYRAILT